MKLEDLKNQATVKLLKGYACGACDTVYYENEKDKISAWKAQDRAKECCPVRIDEYLVCSVCKKEFPEWDEKEAREHIATPHAAPKSLMTPEEIYLDELRWSKRPYLDILRDWDIREHNARFRNA